MTTLSILLTISTVFNAFFIFLILILWFRKCKECGKDKEISRAFSANIKYTLYGVGIIGVLGVIYLIIKRVFK